MSSEHSRSALPCWSLAGMREGARLSLPLLPGTLVMAAAFGTLAAQKGLSFAEAGLMSMLVFAGASQMVALEAWAGSWTVGAVLTLTLVTMTVNSRFVLMSASLRPWFADLPAWQAYPALLLTVDANWLLAMRHRSEGGADVGVYVGSGLVLWAFWVAGTMPGHLLGGLVSDPRRFGLDLVLPIFMAAILVPQWRGISRALPWLVAGGAAALAAQLVPGWWFIIIGALAGGIAGGVLDERR